MQEPNPHNPTMAYDALNLATAPPPPLPPAPPLKILLASMRTSTTIV